MASVSDHSTQVRALRAKTFAKKNVMPGEHQSSEHTGRGRSSSASLSNTLLNLLLGTYKAVYHPSKYEITRYIKYFKGV